MSYEFAMPNMDIEAYRRQKEQEEREAQIIAQQLAEANPQPHQIAQPVPQQQAMPAPNNGLAATAAPFTPMDSAARMIARQVYDTKGLYDEAAKAGDTDTMSRASAFANQLREAGQKYGIDTSRFGADVTRDQLGALLQNDYAKAIADVGNMLTPQEHYAQAFQNYKSQGVSDRRARDLALNDTERYEGEYARKMAVAMDAYGLNADGSMNQHSGLIQTLAYLNNPMGAAIYDRYYANPKDQWNYEKKLEAMGFANGLKMDAAKQNFGFTQALNNDRYAFQSGENEANRQHQMTMLAAKARIDAMAEADKRAWIEANPELAGVLYGRKGSGGTSGGSNGVSDSKMMEVMGILAQLKSELLHGGLSVTDYLDKVAKYRPYMDEDTAWLTQAYGYVKNFLDSYDAGYEGDALKYWNAIKDDNKLLAEIPADIIADMRKRAQAASKSSSSSNNEKAQRSAPQMDENAKAQASIGDEALARAREEEKRRNELIAQRQAEAGYR